MIIQLLVSVVAIIAIIGIVKRLRGGAIGVFEALGWGVLWVGAVVVVWNPMVSNRLAAWLGVGRGADAVMYSAIIILLYAVLRLYAKLESVEHSVSEMVKKIALRDLKPPDF